MKFREMKRQGIATPKLAGRGESEVELGAEAGKKKRRWVDATKITITS
jgi:hypothetical protein